MKSTKPWGGIAASFALAVTCVAVAEPAASQAFPARPVKLVVPYPAGGITDTLGRLVGQAMSEGLGQPVVIDNRGGASGMLGSEMVASAPPDGYTVLLGAFSTHVLNPLLYATRYDARKDFVPLGTIAATPLLLVVNTSTPASTVAELIALAKAQPGKLTFGSYGNASASHLAGELFKRAAGVEMVHVPYKGAAPALNDLMGGQIALMFSDLSAGAHVKAGRIRALATSGVKRSAAFPDLPTVAEAGVPGFAVGGWFALFAPAATPRPAVDRLAAELAKVVNAPAMREKLGGLGLEAQSQTPEQVQALMAADSEKWAKVIRDASIKVQ